MKHYQLKALVAVADHGSIHAAARVLCVSQPAITKAIRDLEAELGLNLLVRQARGARLTQEGRVLLLRARSIVRELERAEEDIATLKGHRGGRLVIGVTPLAGLTILPETFARFRRAWPEVELNFFEFTSDQIYENLKNGTLDLALGALNENQFKSHAFNQALFSLPTSFAVRRGSPLAQARSLAELHEAEWLHSDITGRFPLFLAELFARHQLPPPRRITRCTSQALFHSLALRNEVVFFWSLLAIDMPGLREQFQLLELGEALPDLTMSLMVREDCLLTRAGEYFIRCIHEVCAEGWQSPA